MTGRWRLEPRGARRVGRPWLVLRGERCEGVLWNGPVLDLDADVVRRLGPDILALPLDAEAIVRNLRAGAGAREIGDALLDQRLVAGIGNMWKAEALWAARVSPWVRVAELDDEVLRRVVFEAARLMQASLSGRPARQVYRRRVCTRCGGRIAARGQGDDNRTTWWCPHCQEGKEGASA
jgi:endonuclease-8